MVLLNKIGSFHLCEGNLCSEFSDVVVHNKGKFYGTDRKLFKTLSNFINYILQAKHQLPVLLPQTVDRPLDIGSVILL